MRRLGLFVIAALAACSGGPTREESQQLLAATTAAMTTARTRALADAGAGLTAPAAVTLDFHGACSLGGTVAVAGMHEAVPGGATFDLSIAFDACQEAQGTLDGDLHWTSSVNAGAVSEKITGSIDLASPSVSAACSLDVSLDVGPAGLSYSGAVCGNDVELHVGR